MASEFDLIARYFTRTAPAGLLGVGDDCALFPVPPGEQVATSTDLLLEGRHFFSNVDPRALGHKALAVNLSDLAAMGARPIGCVLGLALPRLDEPWLAAFADGFHALADAHGCPLIGGDTTRSAHDLAISVTVFGAVPAGQALRRDGAQAGDDIWVSGELGAADVAYRLLDGQYPANDALLAATRPALEWPQPQVPLGLALRGIAHAAIDLSDGLLQDLGHILAASRLGANLEYARMPVAAALAALDDAPRRRAVLGGGDVYQLCFTAPAARREAVQQAADQAQARVTRVGHTLAQPGLRVLDAQGQPLADLPAGFDHFPAA
ncbi:thiamine-phosphate kinase [Achromobacter spanius]|uniref:Thiamine-monophosphate kinase n=1 Tax=Achromobacter spanius TaxID=217203 RepID=A0A2S5GYL7_9BURK|nr:MULTISPECIES: thiamine-phosphate kinase [Achromobacter]AYD66607.1 thiamine-phosphate kinase [Achromobacter sp. B7]MDX3984331.1 thiamine-phosphate kinase [Achromobacter sp.]PPA78054.1 thiamine-phosphate kinase [Achromobacter spanius]